MTSGAAPAALRADLGDALALHAPVEIDGVEIGATLRPANAEALAAALARLSEAGLAAVVRGGGSRLDFGNPPRRADLLLSTERLSGVEELDLEDGVVRAGAGTPLAELRAQLAAAGARWELPLDPPGARATLGGALAAGASGPRRLGFGAPRDCVLGLDVALASGELTRCGGRVVKNVTGYDLAKLYVGSFGTLGVISAAWLRLRPAPGLRATLLARLPDEPSPWARALAAARLATARAAVLEREPAEAHGAGERGAWRFAVELAGEAPAVERDAGALAELGAAPAPASLVDELRERAAAPPGPERARLRVGVVPGALAAARERLEAAPGCRVERVQPGLGALAAVCELGGLDAALAAAREAARAGRGSFAIESLPARAKPGRDVFGEPGEALALMRALKLRFDPRGVLNPGRFAGGL
jgi:glycolate oxidase FAD binding subunit